MSKREVIDLTGDSDDDYQREKTVDKPRVRICPEDVIELTDSEKEDSEEDEMSRDEYRDEGEEDISENESEGEMEESQSKKLRAGREEEEEEELDPMSWDACRELIYDAIDEAFGGKVGDKAERRERINKGRTAIRRSVKDIKVTAEDYIGPPPPSGGTTSSRKSHRLP